MDECLPRLEGRVDLAIPVALARGLRWWILPCLPRDAEGIARDPERAWDRRIAERAWSPRGATPRRGGDDARGAGRGLHPRGQAGRGVLRHAQAGPGQPGPPVCVCGLFALTWQAGDPFDPNLSRGPAGSAR